MGMVSTIVAVEKGYIIPTGKGERGRKKSLPNQIYQDWSLALSGVVEY
jgi:hypothetical protein